MKTIKIKLVKKVILCLLLGVSFGGFSQVGIGTTEPTSQAALDIRTTDKGLLLPRLTTSQRTILGSNLTTAADSNNKGMQVFDTDLNSIYFWSGTQWVKIIEDIYTVTNASGIQMSVGDLVFIQKSETAINNAAKYLINAANSLLDDAPIVGAVGGTANVSHLSTFNLLQKGKISLVGVNLSCNAGDEVWFRPFEAVDKWGTTAGTAGNAIRLGYALTNLGTNTNFLIDFNPQWASEVLMSTASTNDHKPVIDVNINNSASITRKGRYTVGPAGINAFLGKNNWIADYDGSAFTFTIPTLGYRVQVVEGFEIGKVYVYNGTAWLQNSKTTPIATDNFDIQKDYVANDLIVRNNKIYQANGAVSSNTAFAIGTTGATWKKISAIPEWEASGVYETGDIVKKDGLFFEANANIPTNTAFIIGTTGATWKTLIGTAEYNSVYPTNGSTTSSDTFADVPGATLNLPSAGVYRVYYNMGTTGPNDGHFTIFAITNSSNSIYSGSYGNSSKIYGNEFASGTTQELTITVSAPTTIKLRWRLGSFGTSYLINNTNTNSVFGYEKIAGFLPITTGITGTNGIPNWLDGGGLTIGATTTAPTKPTTTVADKIYYKQVGPKTWQVEGVISWASSTGSSAGSGDYLITLPNGLQFDNSILTQAAYTANLGANSGAFTTKGLPNSNVTMFDNYGYYNTSPSPIIPWDASRFRLVLYVSGSGIKPWGSGWIQIDPNRTMELRFSFTFQSAN